MRLITLSELAVLGEVAHLAVRVEQDETSKWVVSVEVGETHYRVRTVNRKEVRHWVSLDSVAVALAPLQLSSFTVFSDRPNRE